MNAQQFLTWMRSVRTPSVNPGTTSREESAQLDALLDSFPYFQSGHLLYIKNLHTQGSFLYNNQLKTAAAYAVNRKVLYNLITLKAEEGKVAVPVAVAVSEQSTVEQSTVKQSTVEQSSSLQSSEEQISVAPKFPPKKFTSNPDEWEAGMLRQLQLLHHWQQSQSAVEQSSFDYAQDDKQSSVEQSSVEQSSSQVVEQSSSQQTETTLPTEEPVAQEKLPDAKEEINTLLYVLVEPGQSEDLAEENEEEISGDVVTEESETTQWEIKIAAEEKTESETPIAVPTDLMQQEIIVEAIHSTFELEVDDTIPSVEELNSRQSPFGSTSTPLRTGAQDDKQSSFGYAQDDKQSDSQQSGSQQSSFDSTSTPLRTGAQDDKQSSFGYAQDDKQSGSQQSELSDAEKGNTVEEEIVVSGMEMSFSQWLQEVNKSEGNKSEVNKSEVGKSEANKSEVGKQEVGQEDVAKKELPKTALSTDVLVEQFIKDEPRIKGKKSGFYNPVNMAKKSVQESDEFITETLARIYAKQGNTVKAVRAYQKLSLKFPEKTAYFAALIEELKRTPNK